MAASTQCLTCGASPNNLLLLLHASRGGHGKLRSAIAYQLPTTSKGGMGGSYNYCSSSTIHGHLSLLKLRLLPFAAPRHRLTQRRLHSPLACYHAPPPPTDRTPNPNLLASLAIAVAIPVVSGMVASLFNAANAEWYKRLRKPDWNPPAWLFGAAWGVLYGVMGLASWLVWAHGGWEVQGYALSLYALQLLLNLAWPALFFGAKHMTLALADILTLWVVLAACIRAFEAINPIAARLLYPYLAWVTFAAALNYSYWELNSAHGGKGSKV